MFWNRVTDTYSNYGFKHVGLLLLLALYSAIGGVVFRALESGHEEEHLTQIAATSMLAKNDLKSNLRSIFFNYSLSEDMKVILTEEAIKSYDAKMGTRIINVENDRQWTVWGGLYYAGTIYTSIGYGDISAKTTGGRIATVIYAIFGIPLVITILNDWGSLLFILMQKMWNRYLISCFDWMASIMPIACRQRCRSILPSRMEESFSGKHHHDDGHTLPLKFVVFLLIFWVMLCAAIFCIFQPNWNYATSLYFFFISLTTIGLGDIVPDHKVAVLSFLLILIGLSVVSMSISVIQVKLELLFNRIISSMDHDFKNNLDKQNGSAKSRDQSVGKGTPSDEKKPTQKGHPATLGVIQQYSNAMKFTDKLLLKFMGSHRKKILTDRYDEKSKLRNSWTQTDRRGFYDMSVQTGDERQAKGIPVFEDIKSNLRFGFVEEMLKSKNSKQPKGERRVSNFSNIPGDANGEARKGEQNVTDLMDSPFSSKYKVSGAHKAVERQGSKEVGQSKPRVEKEAVVGRSMQRKGAIADEYAHKMLASEAVVSETLRISGLRFH